MIFIMKRLILLLVILSNLILTVAKAKELSVYTELHYVGGVSGVVPFDLNGNKCAKVKVSMPYDGKDIEIECSRKIGNIEKGIGTYSFWVAPPRYKGKQFFTIRTNEYLPLNIDLWSTDGQLIGGHVYEVVINVPERVNTIQNVEKEDEQKPQRTWFYFPSTYNKESEVMTVLKARYTNKGISNATLEKVEFYDDKTVAYFSIIPNSVGDVCIGNNTFLKTEKERLYYIKSKGIPVYPQKRYINERHVNNSIDFSISFPPISSGEQFQIVATSLQLDFREIIVDQ